ncbi:MAG: response regulator transcription factor [Verrucomicrobiae bacterium]|nr:response regulator transcription factor [Verrucomicrobiae bacterium]
MPITVCIVDDASDVRESIGEFINQSKDFQCLGAFCSGEEALSEIPKLAPDVVLMDINLPGISGSQCVRKLKDKMPHLQAMMLTVYENSERIFEALSAGACGYLLKSTPPEELLQAMKDMKNGGSPMSSHIARKVVQAFHPTTSVTPLIEQLSPREQQVLALLAEGFAYKQIASNLELSISSIRTYIRSMYYKLHVNSRTEAVVKYLNATGNKPNLTAHN